jgi:putative membrane protein
MINLILTWLLSAAILFFTSRIVDGFEIPNFSSALFVCIIVGMINVFIRPLLVVLTLPINLLSLGLFSFVINAVVLKLADGLTPDLTIYGWGPAILAAIFLSAMQVLGNILLPNSRRFLGKY